MTRAFTPARPIRSGARKARLWESGTVAASLFFASGAFGEQLGVGSDPAPPAVQVETREATDLGAADSSGNRPARNERERPWLTWSRALALSVVALLTLGLFSHSRKNRNQNRKR